MFSQDCQKLTDDALKHVSTGLTQLKSINLSFCVSISDSGLKYLAKMPSLRELNLRSCDNVSDAGMVNIKCPNIQFSWIFILYFSLCRVSGLSG